MKVTSVSYGFTKNLGNFQSERVDVTVRVDDNEEPEKALLMAEALTRRTLNLENPLPVDKELDKFLDSHYPSVFREEKS